MFKASYNKNTYVGTTQLLLQKRNKQFHDLFLKIKDPYSILQFYKAIHKIYKEHFPSERKGDLCVKLLMYLYDKGFCLRGDFKSKLNFSDAQTGSVLKSLGKRHLLIIDKQAGTFSLSADGYLFLKNFSKESTTEMMKVVNNGRTGKKKIFSTIKKKKSK